MPAKPSTPKTDNAAEGLFGNATVTPTPDGAPARQYDAAGKGLSEVKANSPGWSADAPLRNTGTRPTSKSATYPWTADVPVKNVKGTPQKPSTDRPID